MPYTHTRAGPSICREDADRLSEHLAHRLDERRVEHRQRRLCLSSAARDVLQAPHAAGCSERVIAACAGVVSEMLGEQGPNRLWPQTTAQGGFAIISLR